MESLHLFGNMRSVLCILFATLLQATLPFSVSAGELKAYPATLVPNAFADGDSFMVRFDGKDQMLRLYFVDCPEVAVATDNDKRRLLQQSRYFGVDNRTQVAFAGRDARDFMRRQLARPFTVHTARAGAPGRSKKPRIYGMVTTADGKDLAELLVAAGYARVFGVKRERPDGTKGEEYAEALKDVELAAAIGKRGLWARSNPDRLVALRAEQRAEDKELDALAFGLFANLDKDNPLDLNKAAAEDLQQLSGVGPELAKRIVAARPYKSVDELTKVHGIGPKTLAGAKPFLVVAE